MFTLTWEYKLYLVIIHDLKEEKLLLKVKKLLFLECKII